MTKISMYSLFLALLLASALAISVHAYGVHSTPSILIFFANVPGSMVAEWTTGWFGREGPRFFAAAVAANWVFYVTLARSAKWIYETAVRLRRDNA